MFKAVQAQQFLKRMGTGKTRPCLLGCVEMIPDVAGEMDGDAATEVELVVKFSEGCESKSRGLVAEAMAALLAADLDLPVPEPFLVSVEPDFVAAIPDLEIRDLSRRSTPWAFGSAKLPPQYATIPSGTLLPASLIPTATEVLAFDLLIANPDRRVKNPNCLGNGRALAIYDHELAFLTDGIIGWRNPWEEGGIYLPTGENQHVFLDAVRGQSHDLSRLLGALECISERRVAEYVRALPAEWGREDDATRRIAAYILELRNHAAAAISQIQSALR